MFFILRYLTAEIPGVYSLPDSEKWSYMDNLQKNYPQIPRKGFLPPAGELPISLAPARPSDSSGSENWTVIPHVHEFMELVLILSGTATQWINGRTYPVFRGDIFLLRGDIAHCFTEFHNLHLMNLLFVPEELPLPYEFLERIPGYRMFFHTEPSLRAESSSNCGLHLNESALEAMEQLLVRLEKVLQEKNTGYEARALTLFQEIILTISDNYSDMLVQGTNTVPHILNVITRMEQDFSKPWTLKELAAMACTSPRNFLRLFYRMTGSAPFDYLQRLRLNHAAELLRKGVRIADVAENCGFANANYFSKRFRKFHGVSPRDFLHSEQRTD